MAGFGGGGTPPRCRVVSGDRILHNILGVLTPKGILSEPARAGGPACRQAGEGFSAFLRLYLYGD